MSASLAEIYQKYSGASCHEGSDRGTVHSYIEPYTDLLEPYRCAAQRMLEIGIMTGHSLRMWEEYFNGAEVHGVDRAEIPHEGIADLRPMIAEGTHRISILDASNAEQVEQHFHGVTFDVIIEDASHMLAHQLGMYQNFKSHVSPGGVYIIEDIEDLDRQRPLFEAIDPSKIVNILDLRKVKGRYDDVLVVITGF